MAEVLNKRSDLVQASGIPTVPLASQMKYGELALNYANGAETMFIKNSNDNIVSFSNDNIIIGYVDSNLSNYYTKLLSGNAKIFSGTCSTAAATTAKVVTCTEFTSADLVKGALIFVTFSATNSGAVADLTMDVNGTGAKSIKKIYINTSPANLSAVGELRANQTYLFSYDGTNWVCITLDYNSNTTYSVISDSELRAGTATDRRTVSAARLKANYNITGRTIRIGADTIDVPLGELSENYEMSSLESNIVLGEGDTYEEAFGKLEKAILNNELVTSYALNNLDLNIQTLILDKELLQLDLIDDELVIANALNNLKLDITSLDTSKLDTINSSNKLSADLISNGTTNKVYTDVEQSKLSGIESGAEVNEIETLSINSTNVIGYLKNLRIEFEDGIFSSENINTGSVMAHTEVTLKTKRTSGNVRHNITGILATDSLDLEEEWAMSGDTTIPTVGLVKSKIDTKANSSSLATVATSGSYNDLTNKPTIPTVSVSSSVQYETVGIDINGSTNTIITGTEPSGSSVAILAPTWSAMNVKLSTKAPINSPQLTGTPTAPTATTGTSTTQIATTEFVDNSLSELADVATSGSYNDLNNKPDIPQYVICTLNAYNAMASHDPDTYYIILANGEEV